MKKASQAVPNKMLINERLQHGWSQKEVAEMVGTTTINVSRWERGVTTPSAHFRHQLRVLFGKGEEELGLAPQRAFKNEDATDSGSRQEPTTPIVTPSPQIWYVPLQRNPLFTGYDHAFAAIFQTFHEAQHAALSRSCILSGLGGTGKTQIALEYAYRYRQNYKAVVWIDTSTTDTLKESLTAIANLLPASEVDEQIQTNPCEPLKRWLRTYSNWLFILDNVQDIEVISPILEIMHENHLLITTCTQITGVIVSHIDIEQMLLEDGALYLLRRARYIGLEDRLEDAPELLHSYAERIVQAMHGHPLALDQAGAYIEETGCGLPGYLSLYQTQEAVLLHRRGKVVAGHPLTVACTLLSATEKAEKANPVAAEVLRSCAFLDLDPIPEDLISTQYSQNASNPLIFDAAIAELRKYSLIRRNSHTKTLTIHPFTRVVLKEKYAVSEPQAQPVLASVSEEQTRATSSVGVESVSTRQSIPQIAPPQQQQLLSRAIKYTEPRHLIMKWTPTRFISPKYLVPSLVGVLIIVLGIILIPMLNRSQTPQKPGSSPPTNEAQLESYYYQKDGIGLSNGNLIFDTYPGRSDVSLKTQAALCLQKGDTSCAVNFMTQAISTDVTDGEIQIYNENLHVRQSGAPYITVVLGLAIAEVPTLLLRARAIMQAAFLAQREVNTKGLLPDGLRLCILIDNSGSDNANVATAAQFIANRVKHGNQDNIVAVLGWPSSSQTTNAIDIITGVHLPMISQSASSTLLSGSSPYFFRVNPTDNQQGKTLGDVAVQQFHAKTILLMEDPTDPYSVSLARAFSERATALNANIVHTAVDNFSSGVTSSETYQQNVVKEAIAEKTDLIFMAGFDVDAVRLAHALGNAYRANQQSDFLRNLRVMTGDATATNLLLGVGGGPDAIIAQTYPQDIQRLIFSSFAHPAEWSLTKLPPDQQPHFFSDWANTYKNVSSDASSISQPGSHAILSYDALQVVVRSIGLIKTSITGDTVRQALTSLGKGNVEAYQGISGLISFDSQGDPINKAFVLLDVESVDGSNRMVVKQVVGLFHK